MSTKIISYENRGIVETSKIKATQCGHLYSLRAHRTLITVL